MSKKLLIVNGSPNENGADGKIAKMIAEDVKRYDYETEIVTIGKMDINGCRACMACKKTGECVQKDDMTQMYEKIRSSDMIILASPIYFGAETGQMKCFVDRFYPMVRMQDGQMFVNFGKVSKASILLTCGAPDGIMTYGGVLGRMTKTIRMMGVKDVSGAIIPGTELGNIEGSEIVKDYIESLEFQLEM